MNVEQVKTDLKTWKEAQSTGGYLSQSWITDFANLDEKNLQISFQVDLYDIGEFEISRLTLPTTYPNGSYKLTLDGEVEWFSGNSLDSVLKQVFSSIADKRTAILDELLQEEETPISEFDFDVLDISSTPIQEQVEQDLKQLHKVDGYFGTSEIQSLEEQVIVHAMFHPTRLGVSETVAEAWGIDLDMYIVLSFTFSLNYLSGKQIPKIDVIQSPSKNSFHQKHKFRVWWTAVQRVINNVVKPNWPLDTYQLKYGKNYLVAALEVVEETIKEAETHCMVCWQSIAPGIKPVICDRELCYHYQEANSLGVDMENELVERSDIVDVLISMTYKAAVNPTQFQPFPVYIKCTESNVENTFLTAEKNPDCQKVRQVLDLVPPVSKLREWALAGGRHLQEECYKLHPLMYKLLRWILNSNRVQLKKLPKARHFKEVSTEHQYAIISGPAEKQKKFKEEREKNGTTLAFFDCARWHNVMRQGMTETAKTAMSMLKPYGAGIYLSPNLDYLFAPTRPLPSWPNSQFTGPSAVHFISLCEVLSKYKPNPYYIVPVEDDICTRYLFVYTGPNLYLNAQSLVL